MGNKCVGGQTSICALNGSPAETVTHISVSRPGGEEANGASPGKGAFQLMVTNDTPIVAPVEASILDNTLLFLPESAANELGLEPNMDDKGDNRKTMWFGRVWQLRGLLQTRYRRTRLWGIDTLTQERKDMLRARFGSLFNMMTLVKVQKQWKRAAAKQLNTLSILARIRFAHVRGTVIYAHGSGGCSWDNMRICRMCAGMGFLVVAPDDFSYPEWTSMGKMRHKDLQPLKRKTDDVDYWADDLVYCSEASGSHTYSTKADLVLADPAAACELYEKCYQLRANELHYLIKSLPSWIMIQGFFLGGTSEGAMTIARFDDQRYGKCVLGRFINSFSVEYCYFTPTPEAGQIGGQVTVPTVNIIGTKDQFFGPEDSVTKIVADNDITGYGVKNPTGNGFNTFVKQGLACALVCVLQDGVHSPCHTHDNFLREMFETFFTRPGSIWELKEVWDHEPTMAQLIQLKQREADKQYSAGHGSFVSKVTQLFVPTMPFPAKIPLRTVQMMRQVALVSKSTMEQVEKLKIEQQAIIQKEQLRANEMLQHVRRSCRSSGRHSISAPEQENYYAQKDLFRTAKTKARLSAVTKKAATSTRTASTRTTSTRG